MRTRGLFGWMSAATLIASVMAGCSNGGGDATQFELPELPGATPEYCVMKYAVPNYGLNDKVVVMISNTGKDETSAKTRTLSVISSFGQDNTESISFDSKVADHRLNPVTDKLGVSLEEDGDEGGGDEGGGDEGGGDDTILPTYRCGMYKSVKAFDRLINRDALKVAQDDVLGRWAVPIGDLSKGETVSLYPPSALSPTASGRFYATKMLDNEDTQHCNILCESNADGQAIIDGELYLRNLAKAFDSGHPLSPSQGIYKTVTNAFGNEWLYTPEGGKDGDKRVNIVLCSNETMAYHLGAVRFCDAFDRKVVATSNEGEFIYINAEKLIKDEDIVNGNVSIYVLGTLAHQMAHLAEMNSKICQDNQFLNFTLGETKATDAYERFGLSEGYAEYAADLCGAGVAGSQNDDPYTGGADLSTVLDIMEFIDDQETGQDAKFNRQARFMAMAKDGGEGDEEEEENSNVTSVPFNNGSIFYNDEGKEDRNTYALSHLFVLNLVQRFGQEKVCSLVSSHDTGIENVVDILGEEMRDLYHNFWKSTYLAQFSGASSKYSFAYLDFGNINYVYGDSSSGSDEAIPYLLKGRTIDGSCSISGKTDFKLKNWSAYSFAMEGGRDDEDGDGTLYMKFKVPANGDISVFELKNGVYSGEITGEKSDWIQGRPR